MASRGINKVILIGRLGNDPEFKILPSGTAAANLSIATSETWRDKVTGEQKEKTEWHRVALFGKTAEIANQYLQKGSQVYIEGQLQTRKWQDNTGTDRYTTEIILGFNGTMQMLGSRNDSNNNNWGQPQQPVAPQQQQQYQQQPQQQYQQQPAQNPTWQTAPQPQQQYQQQPQQQYQQQPMQASAPNQAPAPADFDDDIPFAPMFLQHSKMIHCI